MDEIIIRSLQGQATSLEEETLRLWRQESLQHERAYRDTARAWRLAALIEPKAAARAPHRLAAALRLPAHARGRQRHILPKALRLRHVTWSAAASLVAGLGVGLFWPSHDDAARFAAEEFVTGPNELVTTRLSDGTVVRLGPQSRLRVGPNGRQREVWLDGRGFFAVARDDRSRFVVRTRAGDAIALGTRFDVQVQENGMRVFVVEGRVAHHAGGHAVQIGAMQLSQVDNGGAPAVQPVADAKPLLSWLGEFLVFQTTPIEEVARELERRFAVKVRVADARVAARTVTAWFTNESLEQVLLIVCRAAEAHCRIADNTVSIEP